ncbi:MAG TPA: CRTAC1 family protein [Pyrinomonadaceae bacterium]|nr:CRTAC1 family protein [Pyrinomonadaceae bacterium]
MRFAFLLFLLPAFYHGPLKSSAAESNIPPASPIQFVDITTTAGIKWNLKALAPGARYLIETMGGGGGFIDYNGDGLLDIYLICYSQTPQPAGASKLQDVLYRNNGNGTFTDVTESAGIANSMLGMGMAVGDYNNDGWQDMYITGYGASKLYRNSGKGTFTDVTRQAGVNNNLWGTSAAFVDYDKDGHLDLFVCNYLTYDESNLPCTFYDGKPYCSINKFKGSASRLFQNNRDGTFTDVSEKAGIANPRGKGLGVIALDYNNDGRPDIFQANDTAANFLYSNNGDGTFSDVALAAGVAFDPDGNARGGMGTDAEDLNGDDYLEIFVANFSNETNALFQNDKDGLFTETTNKLGLGTVSLPMSGFGSRFLDYNNDGLVDLFVLNGHPFEPINKLFPETTYKEPPFLFENTGKGFRDVAAEHGAALKKFYAGRGLAAGDIDNDGDSDLLLMNVGEPPVLLRNDRGNTNHWLGINAVGTKSNRDGVGAKITVTAGGKRKRKQRLGGTSYCSASDPRLLFGLGSSTRIEAVEVRWPSGQISTLENVRANQYLTIKEGAFNSKKPSTEK